MSFIISNFTRSLSGVGLVPLVIIGIVALFVIWWIFKN